MILSLSSLYHIILMCIFMQANYKVVEWSEANDLKFSHDAKFVETISYNLSSLYVTNDRQYILLPINPFGKALITSEREQIERWVEDSFFPTEEVFNNFYIQNKDKIDRLPAVSRMLVDDLANTLSDYKHISTNQMVDEVYNILKKQKTLKKWKLNFVALAGNRLIELHPELGPSWGVLYSKQLLNPVASIVLCREIDGEERYFNLEEKITGKFGYNGMQGIEHNFLTRWSRPNEFNELKKL